MKSENLKEKMEFNKPSSLGLNGNLAENFRTFNENVKIYFLATETVKKSREVQVVRLKNLIGNEALKLFNTMKNVEEQVETVDSILDTLEQYCNPKKNLIMEIYKFFEKKHLTNFTPI